MLKSFQRSDRLLYVISAKQEMSWKSFKKAFNDLYVLDLASGEEENQEINLKYERFQTVRAFSFLGHCDFDFNSNNSRVYAAPPALVRLPCAGFPQAILAGWRSPQTIDQLSKACESVGPHINLEITEQPGEFMLVPVRVAVRVEEVGELEAIATRLKIPFIDTPPAWSILHFAGSLDDYLAKCQWRDEPELDWKSQTFDPVSWKWKKPEQVAAKESEICLKKYSHPSRQTEVYYLRQDGQCTEVDLDWGRYAVFKAKGQNVLVWDKGKFTIALPVRAKLPRLLERALALCSGFGPKTTELKGKNAEKFNLFRDVPPQIAEIIAAKLAQTL